MFKLESDFSALLLLETVSTVLNLLGLVTGLVMVGCSNFFETNVTGGFCLNSVLSDF